MNKFDNLTEKVRKEIDRFDKSLDEAGDKVKSVNVENIVLSAIVILSVGFGFLLGSLL